MNLFLKYINSILYFLKNKYGKKIEKKIVYIAELDGDIDDIIAIVYYLIWMF